MSTQRKVDSPCSLSEHSFPADYAENKYGRAYDDFPFLANTQLPKKRNEIVIIIDRDRMTAAQIGEAYKVLDEALKQIAGS